MNNERGYENLLITLLLTVRHLAPVFGTYRMFRYKDYYLNLGPFFVINSLHIIGMIIQEQKISKIYSDHLSAQLLIGLFFHLAYLITSRQFAQIVYQLTILINVSWSLRQQSQEDIELANLALQFTICLCPLYGIFKAVNNKDLKYLSKWYCFCYAMESLIWVISSQIIENTSLLVWPPVVKFILILGTLRVYLELKGLQKIKQE